MTVSSSRIPRTLLTYGRFDGFHQEHIRFLRQLAGMGQELIVGCATDALAVAHGQPCETPYEERRELLEACRFVARVIPETDLAQKRTDIVNYNVAALVMGSEHHGQYDDLQDIAQVLYLPRVSVWGAEIDNADLREAAIAG